MEARTFEDEYCTLNTNIYTLTTVLSSFNVRSYALIATEKLENVTTNINPTFEVFVTDLVNYCGGFPTRI